MAKYLANSSGKLTEVHSINVSAGAGDANKIIETDASGKLDVSFLPVGIGAEVSVMPSSENFAGGDWLNIYNNTGVANARKADATTNTKPCDGFTLSAVTSPANVTVYGLSQKNTAVTGYTVAADYWLGTTAGLAVTTAPSAAGNIVQLLGKPISATAMILENTKFYYTLVA